MSRTFVFYSALALVTLLLLSLAPTSSLSQARLPEMNRVLQSQVTVMAPSLRSVRIKTKELAPTVAMFECGPIAQGPGHNVAGISMLRQPTISLVPHSRSARMAPG
jgi:hypothetical protein